MARETDKLAKEIDKVMRAREAARLAEKEKETLAERLRKVSRELDAYQAAQKKEASLAGKLRSELKSARSEAAAGAAEMREMKAAVDEAKVRITLPDY